MHPDLYTDIHTTLEGIRKYLDETPIKTKEDMQLYSRGLEAIAQLKLFLDAATRRDSDES